mgnify:CR=1 FL=1
MRNMSSHRSLAVTILVGLAVLCTWSALPAQEIRPKAKVKKGTTVEQSSKAKRSGKKATQSGKKAGKAHRKSLLGLEKERCYDGTTRNGSMGSLVAYFVRKNAERCTVKDPWVCGCSLTCTGWPTGGHGIYLKEVSNLLRIAKAAIRGRKVRTQMLHEVLTYVNRCGLGPIAALTVEPLDRGVKIYSEEVASKRLQTCKTICDPTDDPFWGVSEGDPPEGVKATYSKRCYKQCSPPEIKRPRSDNFESLFDFIHRRIAQGVSLVEMKDWLSTARSVLPVGAVHPSLLAPIEWVYSSAASRPGRRISFAKTETTVRQYQNCLERGPCPQTETSDDTNCWSGWGDDSHLDHPQGCVTWEAAETFCKWSGARLPTESEWLLEATNKHTLGWPWGNTKPTCDYGICAVCIPGTKACFREGCGSGTSWPVCSRPLGNSVSGLCDMYGNLQEWTSTPGKTTGGHPGHVLLGSGLFFYCCGDKDHANEYACSKIGDTRDVSQGGLNWIGYGFRCVKEE